MEQKKILKKTPAFPLQEDDSRQIIYFTFFNYKVGIVAVVPALCHMIVSHPETETERQNKLSKVLLIQTRSGSSGLLSDIAESLLHYDSF